jgi:hypothetical protein
VRKRITGRQPAGKHAAGVRAAERPAKEEEAGEEKAAREQAVGEPHEAGPQEAATGRMIADAAADADEPLPHDADAFWRPPQLPSPQPFPERPKLNAVLPLRLGPLPFWRAEQPFLEAMSAIYAAASDRAVACVVDAAVPDAEIDDGE